MGEFGSGLEVFAARGKNIGVPAYQIATELRKLLDDVNFWIENRSFPIGDIALRFHRRLVWIHLFPNGNGRHARLATDVFLKQDGAERFSWGRRNLVEESETRKQYIAALRAADRNDYGPLSEFVRSWPRRRKTETPS